MTVRKLIKSMEAAYGALPARHKQLLESGEHEKHEVVELSGWLKGRFKLDFTDELLPDVHEFGNNLGIMDMDDVTWPQGLAPLASLWPVDEESDEDEEGDDEEDEDEDEDDDGEDEEHYDDMVAKAFLVIDLKSSAVLLFDYDGWTLYPVADSLDAFVADLPKVVSKSKGSGHIDKYGKKK